EVVTFLIVSDSEKFALKTRMVKSMYSGSTVTLPALYTLNELFIASRLRRGRISSPTPAKSMDSPLLDWAIKRNLLPSVMNICFRLLSPLFVAVDLMKLLLSSYSYIHQ